MRKPDVAESAPEDVAASAPEDEDERKYAGILLAAQPPVGDCLSDHIVGGILQWMRDV